MRRPDQQPGLDPIDRLHAARALVAGILASDARPHSIRLRQAPHLAHWPIAPCSYSSDFSFASASRNVSFSSSKLRRSLPLMATRPARVLNARTSLYRSQFPVKRCCRRV